MDETTVVKTQSFAEAAKPRISPERHLLSENVIDPTSITLRENACSAETIPSKILPRSMSTTSGISKTMRRMMALSETTCVGHGDEELFEKLSTSLDEAIDFLQNDLVGRSRMLEGPFGARVKVYLDYTATGQSLKTVNKYMSWLREHLANTHTVDSTTGRFMTSALEDAIKSIETCVNAQDKFIAICTGTGSTGAMLRLQQILGIYIPPAAWSKLELLLAGKGHRQPNAKECVSLSTIPNAPIQDEKTFAFSGECPLWWRARERVKSAIRKKGHLPLVFVGGFEHHSNELSWRYGLCDVIRVPLTKSYELDLGVLERLLREHRSASPQRPIIGSFNACSNVTGMRADLGAISQLLRKVGARFFVDFAACGPHQQIDCCPEEHPDLFDGFVLSPHKFLAGDGACGLLVLRKSIYDVRLPPTFAAGGTINFVGQQYHTFSDDIQERENAGTPGVLQIYQCALAFEVKELVGPENIRAREAELLEDFLGWIRETYPNEIFILGNPDPKLRSSIVAFNVVSPWPLHPRFVTVLLSDLFGVQTRAGCSCAGPHGQDLFGSTSEMEEHLFTYLAGEPRGYKVEDAPDAPALLSVKPGWCRLNLHYTMHEDEMWYLKEVLSFLVGHGARFLSVYSFDAFTGSWEFSPPESLRKILTPAGQNGQHCFGLHAAYGCQESRKLIDDQQDGATSCWTGVDSRRALLEGQLTYAKKLLQHLPEDPALAPPPAPFPRIVLPSHGQDPFFVVAQGQIHNVEKMVVAMERRSSSHGNKVRSVPQITQSIGGALEDLKIDSQQSNTGLDSQAVNAEPVTLSWSSLSFAVNTGRDKKDILRSCSGIAKPGQVLCILGPSGAGKTSLLDALSDRIRPGRNRILQGQVLVNGFPRDSNFRCLRSHVPQFHTLYWMFTVSETLWQAAHLVMPWSTSIARKEERIQEIIEALGLQNCANTKVGLPFVFRGLSGGQLKRLSIGVELLRDPSLLICDEPTSSLDAKAAEQVMFHLCKIAETKHITVVSTIHQPSTKIWESIDQVCLMTGGRTAYFGPRAEAVDFFASQGFTCPRYSNPADFFLDILNSDFVGGLNNDALEPLFQACREKLSVEMDLLNFTVLQKVGRKSCANNGLLQFVILLRRLLVKNLKDPGIFWVRMVMYSALSVLVALLFHGLGEERTVESVQSRLALNFYIAAFFVFMAIAAAPQLIEDRGVFVRERSNGYYATLPYCIANYFAILPGLLIITLVTGVIIIPSTGIMSFGKYCCMMFPALAVAEGVVNVFSAFAPHYIVSSALVAGLNGGFMLVEGFMQVKSDIPTYLVWMHHAAYHTYVFRLAMTATFQDLDNIDTAAGALATGADILKTYDMDDADETTDYLVLICYALGLQVLIFVIMWWLHDGRH